MPKDVPSICAVLDKCVSLRCHYLHQPTNHPSVHMFRYITYIIIVVVVLSVCEICITSKHFLNEKPKLKHISQISSTFWCGKLLNYTFNEGIRKGTWAKHSGMLEAKEYHKFHDIINLSSTIVYG